MLALNANHVMALRLSKLAFGGAEAHSEAKLLIAEKMDAAMVVTRYREHVSANANRLSLR
jgi:hypothetical protein